MNSGAAGDVAPNVRLRSRADTPSRNGLVACALLGVTFAAALVRAQSLVDSPWVGTWLLHEPNHGSYQATEYRFFASGRLHLSATLDTVTRDARQDRILGRVYRGHLVCEFGTRWRAAPRPTRVVLESTCSDGRARDIVLEVADDFFTRSWAEGTPRVVTVGGRTGFRFVSSYDKELVRCGTDPTVECWALANREGVQRRPPAATDP